MIWQIICPSLKFYKTGKKKFAPICSIKFPFLAPTLQTYQKIKLENIFIWISSFVENNALKIINWLVVLGKLKFHQLKNYCFHFWEIAETKMLFYSAIKTRWEFLKKTKSVIFQSRPEANTEKLNWAKKKKKKIVNIMLDPQINHDINLKWTQIEKHIALDVPLMLPFFPPQ